jgi:hypothetical protein
LGIRVNQGTMLAWTGPKHSTFNLKNAWLGDQFV